MTISSILLTILVLMAETICTQKYDIFTAMKQWNIGACTT